MKITDTSRLCDLAIKSLDEALIPELQTSAAKNAAVLIRDALRAASRRSNDGASELLNINRDGLELARLTETALSSHGVAVTGQDLEAPMISTGLESAAHTQEQLSAHLASLVDEFSRNVPAIQRTAADAHLLRRVAKWNLTARSKQRAHRPTLQAPQRPVLYPKRLLKRSFGTYTQMDLASKSSI